MKCLITTILAMMVMFVFDTSVSAQVETSVTQMFTVNGGRWNKMLKNGDPVTIFSYKKDGDTHSFGIYSDDYAGVIDMRIIPFDVDVKQLKKLPKSSKKKLSAYTETACLKAREKALAGKYKTTATDAMMSRTSDIYVSKDEPIIVIGYEEEHSLVSSYFYYSVITDDEAGVCYCFDLDKVKINNVPLPFLPRTDDPQVIAAIKNAKRNITERKNAESRAWYEKQEKLAAERQAKREAERKEEKKLEAKWKAQQDSIDAVKKQENFARLKTLTPAFIEIFGWNMDSAGGIEVDITFTNCSPQKVKYVYFRGYFLNAVGDRCRNEITGSTEWKYRGVGPINPFPKTSDDSSYGHRHTYFFSNPKFYSSIAHTFRLSSVTIEYMNGKKTTLSGAELKKRVKY